MTLVRRPPPAFRIARVEEIHDRGPRLARVTLHGDDLIGLMVEQPASSVRLLLPGPRGPEIPEWAGNEFLLADGSRPVIRTVTPLDADPEKGRLTVEVVRHGQGALHEWLGTVEPGGPVAVSGPGRGYVVDERAAGFLLAGDESALPAITQLLAVLPRTAAVLVLVEVADPSGRVDLPIPARGRVEFVDRVPGQPPGTALADAVRAAEVPPDWWVWVAGEAAGVQKIRRHLFEDRGLSRAVVAAHGYWKDSRASRESHSLRPGSQDMLEES